MILNIRGTHGSGKSHIVRKILDKFPNKEIWTQHNGATCSDVDPSRDCPCGGERNKPSCMFPTKPAKQKLLGYEVRLKSKGKKLYVIGPYKTACGGADAIQPYDLIWPRVEHFAAKGHVIFEGALVSSSVGNIGRAMAARRPKDCVVGFMDTPLEVCLERIRKRRKARGDDRPLNPHNTEVKHRNVAGSRTKLEALGLRCVTVPYRKAFPTVLELLGVRL